MKTSVLGYPRIGKDREWKFALESYWKGELSEDELETKMKEIRLQHVKNQRDAGIDVIPVGDFSYYDHVLDTAYMLNWIPKRFNQEKNLETYFSIARGSKDAVASSLKKWFNTNYHYIVPEYEEGYKQEITINKPLAYYVEAKRELEIETKPVLLSPFSFLKLAKGYTSSQFEGILKGIVHQYVEILSQLDKAGVQWVQIDEPILTQPLSDEEISLLHYTYDELSRSSCNIMLQTYFESVEQYEKVITFPVSGIGLDFVHGKEGNLQNIKQYGFPKEKVLGIGLIDGRNIWSSDLVSKVTELVEITSLISSQEYWVQTSCSLLHVPIEKTREDALPAVVWNALSFANDKLVELVLLKNGNIENVSEATKGVLALNKDESRNRVDVQEEIKSIRPTDLKRSVAFKERYELQRQALKLPFLPTTTIGSFPQSATVRKNRNLWRKGELSNENYELFIREETKRWIEIQEQLEVDVLVHGEFERTDMVEFFGEKLDGFVFTKQAWVQSYGSRCVKPPIIYGDVAFIEPMTVKETEYAASLTNKPVKGMLTGPVTILNWSFVRNDIPRSLVATQIALALRQEVLALEKAGISIIQVDEPALREGLPLRATEQAAYLQWAVDCFRLTTSSVGTDTQIHTHMCYCNFEDILKTIEDLDADVISIEASRGHGALIESLKRAPYTKGIGLGVYDIHSPRIPTVEEMKTIILDTLHACERTYAWVNPDCGLKTRIEKEVVDSLRNLVEATKQVREGSYLLS